MAWLASSFHCFLSLTGGCRKFVVVMVLTVEAVGTVEAVIGTGTLVACCVFASFPHSTSPNMVHPLLNLLGLCSTFTNRDSGKQ